MRGQIINNLWVGDCNLWNEKDMGVAYLKVPSQNLPLWLRKTMKPKEK